MKRKIILCSFLIFLALTNVFSQKKSNHLTVKPDSVSVDSIKYELIVFDPGFESWIITRPSMNLYSKEYYEIRNRIYVWEWNYRYDHQLRFGNLYDSRIDYDPSIDYGIELNYRLYNYFRYFEETNKLKLTDQFR